MHAGSLHWHSAFRAESAGSDKRGLLNQSLSSTRRGDRKAASSAVPVALRRPGKAKEAIRTAQRALHRADTQATLLSTGARDLMPNRSPRASGQFFSRAAAMWMYRSFLGS